MTLKTLFTIPIVAILLSAVLLAGLTVSTEWRGLAHGAAAITAVSRARLVSETEEKLTDERIATNAALRAEFPLPESIRRRLDATRRDVDASVAALAATFPAGNSEATAWSPEALATGLRQVRLAADSLLRDEPSARSVSIAAGIIPEAQRVASLMAPLRDQSGRDAIAADSGLAGPIALARVSLLMREQINQIASIWVSRVIAAERPDGKETAQIRDLIAREDFLAKQMATMIFLAGRGDEVRAAFQDCRDTLERGNAALLIMLEHSDESPSPTLSEMGAKVTALRALIMHEATRGVETAQAERRVRLALVLVIIAVGMVFLLGAMFLAAFRLARQLLTLGNALRRIAAGDRGTPLVMHTLTRDLKDMVDAIETLRQTALVADATARQRREAEERRIAALHDALAIIQTVREPARALEHGIARLCEGIDAAIALVDSPPPVLTTAANVAHLSLAQIRGGSAALEESIAAAHLVGPDDREEEAIIARIDAVREQIERRDAAVHGLIGPSLIALRDVTHAGGPDRLQDLISDQFERIESTVAAIAAMRVATARVGAILRELSLETLPDAA